MCYVGEQGVPGYCRGDRGAEGARPMTRYYNLEDAIRDAERRYCVKKENILIGCRITPPQVTKESGYIVYIYYSGGGVEFYTLEECGWVNQSMNFGGQPRYSGRIY